MLGLLVGTAAGCGDGADADPDTGTQGADATSCQEPEEIDSNITEDTTWSGQPGCLDYVVVEPIDVSASLTVEPGTRVEVEQGNYLEFVENGVIAAEGTEEEPIVFAGTEETAGFWRGISVGSQTNDNVLDYVEIRDAGAQWSGNADSKAALYLFDGHLTITNSTFRNNAHSALQVWNSEASIEGFDNNTFENNGIPMWLHPEHVGDLAGTSSFSGHETSAIQLTLDGSGTVTSSGTWKAFEIPYRLMGSGARLEADVTLQEGTTVEVSQAVRMTMASGGSLSAEGTSDAPVTIRGTEDLAGHWKGLAFRTSSTDNKLTHTRVIHGGSSNWTGATDHNSTAAIFVGDGGTVNLDDTTIMKSGYHGAYILNGQVISCEGAMFEEVPGDNIYNKDGDNPTCGQ